MTCEDEPAVPGFFEHGSSADDSDPSLPERILKLSQEQPFAVLCTQGQGQPYGSLVCYALDGNLQTAVFATSSATRKARMLAKCDQIAMLIDNRPMCPDDFMKVQAVTLTGRARKLDPSDEYDSLASMLTERHPYLKSFVAASSCVLFRVEVLRYLHVCRFQEVQQWVPG